MKCPNGHSHAVKCGFYKNRNGKVQRYRCGECASVFSIRAAGNHRIKDALYNEAWRLLKTGLSTRCVGERLNIDKRTAMVIQRTIFKPMSRRRTTPEPSANKKIYLTKYFAGRGRRINQYQRQQWRLRVRERLAWLLGKSPRPLTLDELYEQAHKRFRQLRKCALAYILNRNVDEWFVPYGQYWTYHPTYLWPCDADCIIAGKSNLRTRTRKLWFKKYKLKDEQLANVLRTKKRLDRERAVEQRLKIAADAQHSIKFITAGIQLNRLFNHDLNPGRSAKNNGNDPSKDIRVLTSDSTGR